ncbi:MAG: hypothetical protein LUG93_10220 [Lachnospiraceae bacterium]|nr:hypothetical protein [Lachnospiraceae bacterium]
MNIANREEEEEMVQLVNEIIRVAEWVDGHGWSYSSIVSDQTYEYETSLFENESNEHFFSELKGNSNFEMVKPEENKDLWITVTYYAVESEDDDPFSGDEIPDPIAKFEIWYNDSGK